MTENDLIERLTRIESCISELKLQKEVLNLDEACEYMRLSASHIYKLTSKGQIPHYCPNGKRLYFKRSELDTWLLRNPKRDFSKDEIERAAADYMIHNPKRKGVAA
jgi:excisionase family DNA binding protein